MSLVVNQDTIAAIATAQGAGGVGVVRISGTLALDIASKVTQSQLVVRQASFRKFFDEDDTIMDEGIVLFFHNPDSFTGEDVVELQGHGGAVVLQRVLKRVIALGARLANPGEFSERAFLNGKMDLLQAEAVADLIAARTEQAAKSAMLSLQGVFSECVTSLVHKLTDTRVLLEANIDFSDEDIEVIGLQSVHMQIDEALVTLKDLKKRMQVGRLLQDGATLVLLGLPNVGKSSLLNVLSGTERSIVTPIPGTTRDYVKETIEILGFPFHVIDTAGVRDANDAIEEEGVRRSYQMASSADLLLIVQDMARSVNDWEQGLSKKFLEECSQIPKILIRNKIDLLSRPPQVFTYNGMTVVEMSAMTQQGVDSLVEAIKTAILDNGATSPENIVISRQRHWVAITKAEENIQQALWHLENSTGWEFIAEELRVAQNTLGELTGQVSSDDLLGKIFSEFCIGK